MGILMQLSGGILLKLPTIINQFVFYILIVLRFNKYKIMNKLFTITLLYFIVGLSPTYSQVTIGSAKRPVTGALLELNDGTTEINNTAVNSSKGLGLPRVNLEAYDKLKLGNITYTDKQSHIGLLVYNLADPNRRCEANHPTNGLHVWDGEKWQALNAEEKYNPAPPNIDLNAPIYQPNAYLVTKIGSSSTLTIPIEKAFAVWEYWASEEGGKKLTPRAFTGTLTTKIEWQEGMGSNNDNIVSEISLSSNFLGDRNASIIVTTTGNIGNAVVSLSDSNGVLWSWHIWVSPQPATNTYTNTQGDSNVFMDRNLGATSATPSNDGTLGLYYQWGRHTPIPGYKTFSNVQTNIALQKYDINDILELDGNGDANALSFAIKNPLAYITNSSNSQDWFSITSMLWNTRWAEQLLDECLNTYDAPSITNPCPQGWKIPNGTDNHSQSPWEGLTSTNGTWNIGWAWTDPTAGYYPSGGHRDTNGLLRFISTNGYYWSSSPNEHRTNYLYFGKLQVYTWHNGPRANGFSVRCVLD